MTAELIITRGLPASGKTTWAKAWVREEPESRVRVNRDDLRMMLFGRPAPLSFPDEQATTAAQHAQVRALLKAGRSVVVDDTHLRLKHARAWADIAAELNVPFGCVDFDTPVDECVRRDALRWARGERAVGTDVIRDMARRFHTRPEVAPTEPKVWTCAPYEPDTSLPKAWIIDIDGTLAHNNSGRGWYDLDRVHEDDLCEAVHDVVKALFSDTLIVVMSGRSSDCRAETEAWLAKHHVRYDELYMRASGDNRQDGIVKGELFDAHLRERFNVVGALDDRDQVVALWRGIGLPCFQVAPGDF